MIGRETLRLLQGLATTVGTEIDDTVREMAADWARQWGHLSPQWRAAVVDLLEASRSGRRLGPWDVARTGSVDSASIATDTALAALVARAATRTRRTVAPVVAATVAAEPHIIASQLPPAAAGDAAAGYAAKVDPAAVDAIRRRTSARINTVAEPVAADTSSSIRRALLRAVTRAGFTVAAVVAEVRAVFDDAMTRTAGIARTELVDARRLTAAYVHDVNADVVAEWVWVSRLLPGRTCASCWAMHGTVHPLTEPGPLDHLYGQCNRVPKLKPWTELGYSDDEPAGLIPDARARFDALPEADQLRILGPARLDLYTTGQISWDDLAVKRTNPGWRDSYTPTRVRDLQRLAALRHRPAA